MWIRFAYITLTLGPDWSDGMQDGGRGNQGVVDAVEIFEDKVPIAWVVWPSGARHFYHFRYGL